ncbi:hypothetical protein TUM4637_31050 [Shewanella hafniensis]|nr:hypothetical protein TUM4637_31050 [Shewanella hafniensis]
MEDLNYKDKSGEKYMSENLSLFELMLSRIEEFKPRRRIKIALLVR